MKKIESVLKNRNSVVFFDLEGTQRTSEMIAIGAVLVFLNKDGTIKKYKKPFKMYVRSTTKVGEIVKQLTSIDDKLLKEKGHSFYDTMVELKKYCGLKWRKSLFVTFGNNDLRILNQTIAHNLNSPIEICRQIQRNYWDFGAFISNYVKDPKYQTYSLVHLCELYDIELATPAHDPAADALNLAYLYDAFIKKNDITKREYKKVLCDNPKLPTSIRSVLKKLTSGQSVTSEDFDDAIKEELK